MNNDEKLNRYRPSADALLNPCHDEVFKALFTNGSEESHTALRCFLTAVLHKEVKDVQLRPNEPPVTDESDKAVRFDVSCTFNSAFHKGNDWQAMPQVYQISLLNFIFDKDDESAVSHYRMRKLNGHLLSGIQAVIFLELPKIDALGDVPPETLHSEERWCKFMIDADNPYKQDYVRHLAEAEGGIMEAKKTLDSISSDWVLWKRELDRDVIESDRKTELRYMQEQGLEQGIQQGKQEGTAQAKREAALNLKKLGVPVQTITQAVGLSEEEIAQL